MLLLSKPERIYFSQVKRYEEREDLLAETKNASSKFAPMHWYPKLTTLSGNKTCSEMGAILNF